MKGLAIAVGSRQKRSLLSGVAYVFSGLVLIWLGFVAAAPHYFDVQPDPSTRVLRITLNGLSAFWGLLLVLAGLRRFSIAMNAGRYRIEAEKEGLAIQYPRIASWRLPLWRARVAALRISWTDLVLIAVQDMTTGIFFKGKSLLMKTRSATLRVPGYVYREMPQQILKSVMEHRKWSRPDLEYVVPGAQHPTYPNVIYADLVGSIAPAPGFVWSPKGSPHVVHRMAGKRHPAYKNVVFGDDGVLQPAPGYTWKTNDLKDLRVVKKS